MDSSTTPGRSQAGVWRFGAVALDERSAAVHVGTAVARLDRSSYDVLLALLRHAGEVVTKDELLEAGWPGRVVSENSLAKAVSRLRQALGDDGGAIRAVHGYGYRLAVAVAFQAGSSDQAPAYPHEAAHLHEGDRLPHRMGWYLGRRLGEGRSGVTFQATSQGSEPRAVKLATGEFGLRCLKREIALARYIMAVKGGLPDVAPVLGFNLSHPPFFIELPLYAQGNLADWAASHGGLAAIDPATRMALCVRLCETVAALHEIGILHKDLKPENLYPVADPDGDWRIVVSDLGAGGTAQTPHLADFGITMSIATDLASAPHAGSMLYLAPEVIAGEVATQRSDVFALGVLVYQLLVGDLRRSLAPGWEADVPDGLLREDIALAAASNPERRQVDARALATRLSTLGRRRQAIEAEHESRRLDHARVQQIARHRRRWRLGVAAFALLALGLAGTFAMYAAAQTARREAEGRARQHQAVLDFINRDIFGQGDAYDDAATPPGISLSAAVERAAARVDRRLHDDPASAAAVHAMVGSVLFARDRHAAAVAEFERARALYRALPGEQGADLARVEAGLCDVHRIAGDLRSAEQACLSALAHARRANADVPYATLKLGQLRTEQGRYTEARALLGPLLSANAFTGDTRSLGELRWALGLCARNTGRFDDALRHFQALLALYRQGGRDSTWLGWAYNSLGSVMVEKGDYADAEAMLLEARDRFSRTQGAGQVEAQMPNIWRAEIRLRQGRWQEAAALQQSLLDAWQGTLKPMHPLRLLAEANLAWAEARGGSRASAQARLDAAWRDRGVVFDPHSRIAERTSRWVRVALALGDAAATDELLDLLDDALSREFPAPHPLRAEAQCLHAHRAMQRGDRRDARVRALACRAMLSPFVPPGEPRLQEAEALLAARGPMPARRESGRIRAARSGP
ncbi:MAG TPA: tetratricopeptide repeat protein [Luteimonas sp.]|nr:tetratricopeptide repeat protein [Luteimonas sp.]